MSEELRALTSNPITGEQPETNVEQALTYIGTSIWERATIKNWVLDLSDEKRPPERIAFPFLDLVHTGGDNEGSAPTVFEPGIYGWPAPNPSPGIKRQNQYLQYVSSEFWEDAKNSPTFNGLAKTIVQAASNIVASNITFNTVNSIRNNIVLDAAVTEGRTIAVDPLKPTAAEIDSMLSKAVFFRNPAEHCFFLHTESEQHFFDLPGFEANKDVESLAKGVVGFYRGHRVVACLGSKGIGSSFTVLFGNLADVAAVWFNKFSELHVNEQQRADVDEYVVHMKWRTVGWCCNNRNQYNRGGPYQVPRILYFKTS